MIALLVGVIAVFFVFALIAGHIVQLALGVEVSTVEWIAAAIGGALGGIVLYAVTARSSSSRQSAARQLTP